MKNKVDEENMDDIKDIEISANTLKRLNPSEYVLLDLRNSENTSYGIIPGAIVAGDSNIEKKLPDIRSDKKIIFYCTKGEHSYEVANKYRQQGYDAFSLKGGYGEWLLTSFDDIQSIEEKEDVVKKSEEVERSIRKKFHKSIFAPFAKACKKYDLIQDGDKIAVCISGGKDSMLMAKCFQELKKHRQKDFELVFLVMDPGYNEINREIIENNAKLLDIPIKIFESDIFDVVENIEKSPCYMCARMRRGYLYNNAREYGCNKIALGHHYDDVIETILMGMLYGAQIQTMMPKLHSTNFEGMELIRPMYLIREADIKHWRDYNNLHFIRCACHFTDTCETCDTDGKTVSKRMEIKQLIASLKEKNPFIEGNIFKSVENVCLDTVIGYKSGGERHNFLEKY